jgi:hypothetical protein
MSLCQVIPVVVVVVMARVVITHCLHQIQGETPKGNLSLASSVGKYLTPTITWPGTCQSTRVLDRSYAKYAARAFAKLPLSVVTKLFILQRNHINVKHAGKHSTEVPHSTLTFEFMMVTNLSCASTVEKDSIRKGIIKTTNWPTAERKHSNAPYATRHSIRFTIWLFICTHTMIRSPSPAKPVERDFVEILI